MDLYADRIVTEEGVFLIHFNEQGIYEIFFPGFSPSPEKPQRSLPWTGLAGDLSRYLRGEEVCFEPYPLDRRGYPPFYAAVLNAVSLVPPGEVITYREAACRAGSPLAWRAAGQALKANRHPLIVPCHRVVGSGGRLGGFSGAPNWKEKLLTMEGASWKKV